MNIDQAINLLKTLKLRHGGTIPVYFDCPNCRRSFEPTGCVAEAVHLTTVPDPPQEPK